MGRLDEACDMALQDLEGVYLVIANRSSGHCDPWWSAAQAAWKLLLVGGVDSRCLQVQQRLGWILSLVCFCNSALLLWCTSASARVEKHNCKLGCARWWLVQLLDYVGSYWAGALLAKHPHRFDFVQCCFVPK